VGADDVTLAILPIAHVFDGEGSSPPRARQLHSYDARGSLVGMTSKRPPQWSSGQGSWLLIQRSGFHFRHYQIFSEVVGLEWGLLSLVSTTYALLERKRRGLW
jgi:hypothetical protein